MFVCAWLFAVLTQRHHGGSLLLLDPDKNGVFAQIKRNGRFVVAAKSSALVEGVKFTRLVRGRALWSKTFYRSGGEFVASLPAGSYEVACYVAGKRFSVRTEVVGHEPILRNQPSTSTGLRFEYDDKEDLSPFTKVRFYLVNADFYRNVDDTSAPAAGELFPDVAEKSFVVTGGRNINPYGTFHFKSPFSGLGKTMRIAVYVQIRAGGPFFYDSLSLESDKLTRLPTAYPQPLPSTNPLAATAEY